MSPEAIVVSILILFSITGTILNSSVFSFFIRDSNRNLTLPKWLLLMLVVTDGIVCATYPMHIIFLFYILPDISRIIPAATCISTSNHGKENLSKVILGLIFGYIVPATPVIYSIAITTFISALRFLNIAYPFLMISRKLVEIILIAILFLSFSFNFVIHFCYLRRTFHFVTVALGFLVSLVNFSLGIVAYLVVKPGKQIGNACLDVSQTNDPQNPQRVNSKEKRKASGTIITLVAVYCITNAIAMCSGFVIYDERDDGVNRFCAGVLGSFFIINSFANPIVFILRKKKLRCYLKGLICSRRAEKTKIGAKTRN